MRDIDLYTKEYDSLPFEAIQVGYRRKKVLEQVVKYNHQKLLEVGCGLEPLFAYFEDFSEMTIVEPSSEFVGVAQNMIKEKICDEKKHVDIISGFIEEKCDIIRDKQYDMIIVSSLLHELENPKKILDTIYDLCSEDTVVHINVPNAKSLHRYLALEMGLIDSIYEKSNQQIKLNQQNTYDIDMLISLVEESGFSVIEKGAYFPKFFTHKQMQTLIDANFINQEILDGLFGMSKYLGDYGSEIYVDVVKRKV